MEIIMIFRVDYSMPVQNVTAAQERFGTMEEKWDGVKLIGRWHEAGNKGFMVVEADDAVSLGKYSNQWTDLCDITIVPVMTDEEVGQVLTADWFGPLIEAKTFIGYLNLPATFFSSIWSVACSGLRN